MFLSVPEVTVRLKDIIRIFPSSENKGSVIVAKSYYAGDAPDLHRTKMEYDVLVGKLYNTIKLWTDLEER